MYIFQQERGKRESDAHTHTTLKSADSSSLPTLRSVGLCSKKRNKTKNTREPVTGVTRRVRK